MIALLLCIIIWLLVFILKAVNTATRNQFVIAQILGKAHGTSVRLKK